LIVLALVGFLTFLNAQARAEGIRSLESRDLATSHNLLANPLLEQVESVEGLIGGWQASGDVTAFHLPDRKGTTVGLGPSVVMTSAIVPITPEQAYRYSISVWPGDSTDAEGKAQLQFRWYNRALDVISWYDTEKWQLRPHSNSVEPFQSGTLIAPVGAHFGQAIVRSLGPGPIYFNAPKLSPLGVHVEPHPNAARASIAFSFDWESAMGGLIHSKGGYDLQAAERRGVEMRQGAEWLNELFGRTKIAATFYSTGYNLLDGTEGKQTFAGDPTYQWARPKNGWADDYWTTHRWYSDDPYGDYETHPAWYFGDLTRLLTGAGHEIASHTFGHLYVRGSNPEELGVDADEWLRAAKESGIPEPTTFAFPWRSSNSLTPDFYDVLYKRGIRAVTRIYERDMRDLYTLYGVPPYPDMYVMPDFLLGEREGDAMENEGGEVIGAEQGLQVLTEAIARRGTTSFWTHPEELAPGPLLGGNRAAWEQVVSATARLRDSGSVWIATVADIVAYQSDIGKVSASLERGFLGWGGWKLIVRNDSGKELSGVTLTMPGEVRTAGAGGTEVHFVRVTGQEGEIVPDKIEVVRSQEQPTRQLVFPALPAGTSEVNIEWAPGQEPLE
jgi:peptidoglycan/xylan/chitin deacetylase (PgdA/CDA1 family)